MESEVTPRQPLRILLVDDHALFREGVAALLQARSDFEVVGEASNGREALALACRLRPDLILMDIQMPVMGGLEATRLIKAAVPEARIVILTVSEEESDLFEAVKAGAQGYLLKSLKSSDLFDLLLGASRGEAAISRLMAAKMLEELARLERKDRSAPPGAANPVQDTVLTEREIEVLRLVARGATNRDIAAALYITDNTVKFHLKRILEKLHLQNRAQAAVYAARAGVLTPDDCQQ